MACRGEEIEIMLHSAANCTHATDQVHLLPSSKHTFITHIYY